MQVIRFTPLFTSVPRGTIYHEQAGGGGYGDPSKRDRGKLAEEVRDGLISLQPRRRCMERQSE
jgi:N-methylhydantoinase B/oxoprolinase/acetone carboxylase alpha subunit